MPSAHDGEVAVLRRRRRRENPYALLRHILCIGANIGSDRRLAMTVRPPQPGDDQNSGEAETDEMAADEMDLVIWLGDDGQPYVQSMPSDHGSETVE